MENEIVVHEGERALTAAQIKAQVQLIQEVMRAVMDKDVHYGVIPGTPKPTLYKPGSEKILSTFRIGVEPEAEDLSTADEVRYRVKARAFSQTTGAPLGYGVGECSSSEEKYKWRKPVCDEEFNETPEDRKRVVWKKGTPNYQQKQIRTNPADVANTILKMAKKRAQIDMTLTVTAASDIFDQDLEDLPEGLAGEVADKKPPIKQPQSKSGSAGNGAEQSVSIIVADIATKTGKNAKGNPWTLYGIKDTDGAYYNTFSDTFAEIAQAAKDSGAVVKIGFVKGAKGNDIKSLVIDEDAPTFNE